ncbi:sensor histidine kinase [Vallitalea okinawensis]|uniref:sensor histidine kinase n=1 Tax=Vallitalea okinawensis TaxID=2078660 RepID=UPI000CFDAC05|nr:ATP-binding protein [Vallitalea okinawensis]
MKSIKTRFFIIFLSFNIVSIALILITNKVFFLDYSIHDSQKNLSKLAEDIIANAVKLEDVELAEYINERVMGTGIFSTMNPGEILLFDLGSQGRLLQPNVEAVPPGVLPEHGQGPLPEQPPEYRQGVSSIPPPGQGVLPGVGRQLTYEEVNREYIGSNELIFRISSTLQGELRALELIINLEDGRVIQLQKPIAIVKENVNASNNFIFIVSMITILIEGILLYVAVGRLTQPIRDLHKQTMKIASLDFSGRFDVQGEHEIARLGENINHISDELSMNIDALQTANEQLKLDVELLKRVDEMKNEFIAIASHEFKTPIGIIQSYADGIKYGIADSDDERGRYLDIILDESDRMANMVRDLVQIIKMQLKEFTLEKDEIILSELLSDLNMRYRKMMRDKKIVFTVKEAKGVSIMMDRLRIVQVIDNFISNACNHTPKGGSISIWTEDVKDGIRINVKNTGSHIDEEKLNQIWDSFYRVDKARSREMGGTGLGLSIVKGIIQAHGGKYGAENTEDGIVFYIILSVLNTIE